MPRKWDWTEMTSMLSPNGKLTLIWDHVWKGSTLQIIFDKPVVEKKIEYILYRKGRNIYYGLNTKKEGELERTWDEDAKVKEFILDAIVQGAKFRIWDENGRRIFIEM